MHTIKAAELKSMGREISVHVAGMGTGTSIKKTFQSDGNFLTLDAQF